MPHPLHDVGPIHAGRRDLDQHLARRELGLGRSTATSTSGPPGFVISMASDHLSCRALFVNEPVRHGISHSRVTSSRRSDNENRAHVDAHRLAYRIVSAGSGTVPLLPPWHPQPSQYSPPPPSVRSDWDVRQGYREFIANPGQCRRLQRRNLGVPLQVRSRQSAGARGDEWRELGEGQEGLAEFRVMRLVADYRPART